MGKKVTLNFKTGKQIFAHEFIVLGRGIVDGHEYASVEEYQLANPHAIFEEGATEEDKSARRLNYLLIEIFKDDTFTYVFDDGLIYKMLGKLLEMAKNCT